MNDEKNIEELTDQAAEDQFSNAENVTYSDGEVFEITDVPSVENHSEADAALTNVKEDAAEETRQNQNEIQTDVQKEEGTGAHSAVRSAWSNGNYWGL